MSECSVCAWPWIKRDGDHAEWCADITAMLRLDSTQRPLHPPTPDDRCGTYAGVERHRQRAERPCYACVLARRREADKRKASR